LADKAKYWKKQEGKFPMRIAVYWESELWGGSDSHLLTLLKNWPDQNDRFTILYNRNNQGHERISEDLQNLKYVKSVAFSPVFDIVAKHNFINNFVAKFRKILNYMAKPYFFWKMVRKCRKLLVEHGPFDGVLADNGGYPAAWGALAAIIAAKQINLPKRLLLIHHAATKPGIYTWEIFEHFVDRMICRSATDLVAVSQATRQTLIDYRWFNTTINPIRVIYNGIDLQDSGKLGSAPESMNLRQVFSLGDSIIVGIVGRIERVKGHEDLIAGFALLSKEYQQKMKLLIIGSGDSGEIERLKKLANYLKVQNFLLFTGYLPGSSQTIIVQLNLLVVMAKDFEGFGLSIGEAMSVGTPVLATRVGAIPEIMNERVGSLVCPESPYEICDALVTFVENREISKQKAVLAKQHIRKFSAERMAKQFHMLFASK